jgi:hypothetical protein
MGLVDLAKRAFDKRSRVDPAALRKCKPIRNTFVTSEVQEDGSILLSAPLSTQGTGVLGRLAKRAGKADVKHFELEQIGAFVWNLCDGKITFDGISKKLAAEFKLSKLEADASLGAFLQMLSQRRLITMLAVEKK